MSISKESLSKLQKLFGKESVMTLNDNSSYSRYFRSAKSWKELCDD